jgi:hypothetical protein
MWRSSRQAGAQLVSQPPTPAAEPRPVMDDNTRSDKSSIKDTSKLRQRPEKCPASSGAVQCPRCNGHGRLRIIALAQHPSI